MSDIEKNKTSAVPPHIISRNKYGLIDDGSVNYVYNEKGKINWRKMIDPKYLVVHKQALLRKNKSIPESIEGLADSELLILLDGIKELARVRGYTQVEDTVVCPNENHVSASCHITWIPNFETEGSSIKFVGSADAHDKNTNGFGKNYLTAIASNRAFVRSVRNFLGIEILGFEEVGGKEEPNNQEDMATSLLKQTMLEHGVSFDIIKEKLIKENIPDADKFTSVDDFPRILQFDLIQRIKKKAAEKAK